MKEIPLISIIHNQQEGQIICFKELRKKLKIHQPKDQVSKTEMYHRFLLTQENRLYHH